MKKQKMERLDGPLFRPLSTEESLSSGMAELGGFHTDHVSAFFTAGSDSPDTLRDAG